MKSMRWLLLGLLLLLAALQYKLWYGSGGQRDVAALKAQVAAQAAENARLQARNDALAAEVADLKGGGEAVEERARVELGMVKPGETFYRVIDRPASAAPAQPPAHEEEPSQ
ncbi:cell division protein FtsB [Thermomonas sp. S9]|uniref:cell division protein FtsB n=1 Tax=Thermomonas sp. S9 TaxID=2885203 RepID=UPI00216AC9E8|nr:cell division protein FtsB [Thermomonas sp. S9]